MPKNLDENLDVDKSFHGFLYLGCLLDKGCTVDVSWELARDGLLDDWLKILIIILSVDLAYKHRRIFDDAKNSVRLITHRNDQWICKIDKYLHSLLSPFLEFKRVLYFIRINFRLQDKFKVQNRKHINCIDSQQISFAPTGHIKKTWHQYFLVKGQAQNPIPGNI